MANRIIGNILIVDSAMGNLPIIESGTGNFRSYNIKAIAFWSADTTGSLRLTSADTTTTLIRMGWITQGVGTGMQESPQWAYPCTRIEGLKAPVVTAGTAWIYLE